MKEEPKRIDANATENSHTRKEQLEQKMNTKRLKQRTVRFRMSKSALAIPITFLLLFVSLLAVISITYYFAVSKVNANSQMLKISSAKQNMANIEQTFQYVLWQPGSSKTCEFNDCGGTLKTLPSANLLTINITDDTFYDIVFNSSIGGIVYELPYSESADTGVYLKGTSQVVENRSGAVIAQLYIESGEEHPEVRLRYRPIVSSVVGETENGKAVNNVRIYVVNLNCCQSLELIGKIPLKIQCVNTEIAVHSYDLAYSPETLIVQVTLSQRDSQVSVPISGNGNGAVINVEVVICNIEVERGLR